MSWSGTVTCSNCYQKGHNKRKCPSLTRDILDYYQSYSRAAKRAEEDGNIEGSEHYARSAEAYRAKYIKRTKIDPATGEKVTNKAAKAERMKSVRCGYCNERGHTRRTCETLKLDKLVFVEASRRARSSALQAAKETGIGVGSLVPMRIYSYNEAKGGYGYSVSLRYVKSVDWRSVTAMSANLFAIHVDARKLTDARWQAHAGRDAINRMPEFCEEAQKFSNSDVPLPSSPVPVSNPPKGWLDCEPSTIDVASQFPTKGSKNDTKRDYRFRWPDEHMSQVIRDMSLEDKWADRLSS